jgi:hypothetical protein
MRTTVAVGEEGAAATTGAATDGVDETLAAGDASVAAEGFGVAAALTPDRAEAPASGGDAVGDVPRTERRETIATANTVTIATPSQMATFGPFARGGSESATRVFGVAFAATGGAAERISRITGAGPARETTDFSTGGIAVREAKICVLIPAPDRPGP